MNLSARRPATLLKMPTSSSSPASAPSLSEAQGASLALDSRDAIARRLFFGALLLTGLFGVFELVSSILGHTLIALDTPGLRVDHFLGLGASLAVMAACRVSNLSRAGLLGLGLIYEALMCLLVSFIELEYLVPGSQKTLMGSNSLVCVLVLFFPSMVPASPSVTLASALLAASMGPVAYAMDVEHQVLSMEQVIGFYATSYFAAVLAFGPAWIMHRLNNELRNERDLGSYRLIRPLGKGGMGEVWLAEHRHLARPAAVKLIAASSVDRGTEEYHTTLARFELEAQATAQLTSPHTVVLFDYGVTAEATFYYCMEVLDGLDLETLVALHGPLPAARVAHLMRQACLSLDEAHEKGLVHRDIKPANLFACKVGTESDFVKVLDFGLVARPASTPSDSRLTEANTVCGTPAYMAPEQAMGEPVDGRTDLYALGCVAFFLLTGHEVFEAATPQGLLIAHATKQPPTPSQRLSTATDPKLESIIMRCLAKEPGRRPASAAALAEELAPLAGDWGQVQARLWWNSSPAARPPKPSSPC